MQENSKATVLASSLNDVTGMVEVIFEAPNNGWDTLIHSSTEKIASLKLLEEAKKKYSNTTEIINIKIEWVGKLQGGIGTFRATGYIVLSIRKLKL